MALALVAALVAAGCYGLASVLQARAAARAVAETGVDPRLLWRLARSGSYLLGVGLLGTGFLLSLVSLRSLPLFMVEVVRASSLGVTAVLSLPLLGIRLRRGEPVALAAIGRCGGRRRTPVPPTLRGRPRPGRRRRVRSGRGG